MFQKCVIARQKYVVFLVVKRGVEWCSEFMSDVTYLHRMIRRNGQIFKLLDTKIHFILCQTLWSSVSKNTFHNFLAASVYVLYADVHYERI